MGWLLNNKLRPQKTGLNKKEYMKIYYQTNRNNIKEKKKAYYEAKKKLKTSIDN